MRPDKSARGGHWMSGSWRHKGSWGEPAAPAHAARVRSAGPGATRFDRAIAHARKTGRDFPTAPSLGNIQDLTMRGPAIATPSRRDSRSPPQPVTPSCRRAGSRYLHRFRKS